MEQPSFLSYEMVARAGSAAAGHAASERSLLEESQSFPEGLSHLRAQRLSDFSTSPASCAVTSFDFFCANGRAGTAHPGLSLRFPGGYLH